MWFFLDYASLKDKLDSNRWVFPDIREGIYMAIKMDEAFNR